jgi:hypothetical protein
MTDPAVSDHALDNPLEESQRRTEQITQVVVRHVYADMMGRPTDQVYRVLNARLHAADVPLDNEQVRQYAQSISDGTWSGQRR